MKRILTVALLLTLFGADMAMAQVDIKPGVRIGANFATLRGDDADELARKTDFLLGAHLLFDLMGPVDVQAEALYSRKGTSFDDPQGAFGADDASLDASYLQLNGLARFAVVPGPVSPVLFAGPYLGIEMSERIEASADGNSASQDSEILKGTDFGVMLGGGVDAAVAFGTLQFDLRYELGLSNLNDSGSDESIKTSNLVLSAGLTF